MTFALAVAAFCFSGCARDPYGGAAQDIGPTLHEFGRPAIWNATHMPLGASGFTAAAGPGRYEDENNRGWDYYTIDIEKEQQRRSYVVFQRDFRMDDIPADLIHKKVDDLVEYNKESGLVVFHIGTNRFTYTLPVGDFRDVPNKSTKVIVKQTVDLDEPFEIEAPDMTLIDDRQ
jgi:hypothetical protein